MNNGYPSISIEDIARLAGETCVYRGASQGTKTAQQAQYRQPTHAPARLLNLLKLFKR